MIELRGNVAKLRIVVRPEPSDDALLTVEDAMQQVLDTIRVLEAAGRRALQREGQNLTWRLSGASTNSPFTVEAVADVPPVFDDVRAPVRAVKEFTRSAMDSIVSGRGVPEWMDRQAAEPMRALLRRSQNGVATTAIDFFDDDPPLSVTKASARVGLQTLEAADPIDELVKELAHRRALGEVSGTLESVGTYQNRPALFIAAPMYGRIACRIPEPLRQKIGDATTIKEVWEGRDVALSGLLHYGANGNLLWMEADDFRARDREAVSLDAVLDPDFTAGREPADYLSDLREGTNG